MGYWYDVEQVEGRWKTLLSAYRRVVDHNNRSGNDRKEMVFYKEVEDIVGDNPTVSPRVVISSTDGLTHPQKQTKKRKLTTATKPAASQELPLSPSTATSSTDDKESPVPAVSKKRRHVAKKPDLVNWLEGYQTQQVEAEERRLELTRKMHEENMTIMSGLIDILKTVVNKN